MKKLTYDDIIYRIGYFRNQNKLSARETSLRLGYSDSFMNRIERKNNELKVSTLMNFMELVNITPEEFFYSNLENYEKDKELLDLILSLSNNDKDVLLEIAKRLNKK